jgi:hypothetical protein
MPVEPKTSDTTLTSARHSTPSESIVESIIDEVLKIEGCEFHELPPLYESIDPDALTALYAHGSPEIRFQYAGYRIEITSELTVHVTHDA